MKSAHAHIRLVDPDEPVAVQTRDYRDVLRARGVGRLIVERTLKEPGDLEMVHGRMIEHG